MLATLSVEMFELMVTQLVIILSLKMAIKWA